MPVFDCEGFKDIPFYPGYQINPMGILIRLSYIDKRGVKRPSRQILPSLSSKGYLKVEVTQNGKKTTAQLHRLLALAFIPNPQNLPQINHKDGIKENITLDNLEWSTCQNNIIHAYKNNLVSNTGMKNNSRKISDQDVKEILKRRALGESLKSIANDYPISISAVCKITTGVNWKCQYSM